MIYAVNHFEGLFQVFQPFKIRAKISNNQLLNNYQILKLREV